MTQGQSRMGSFMESLINVVIGFGINFVANLVILPLFGFATLTLQDNFLIGLIYTVISVVRSYTIRRWFNGRIHHLANMLSFKKGF